MNTVFDNPKHGLLSRAERELCKLGKYIGDHSRARVASQLITEHPGKLEPYDLQKLREVDLSRCQDLLCSAWLPLLYLILTISIQARSFQCSGSYQNEALLQHNTFIFVFATNNPHPSGVKVRLAMVYIRAVSLTESRGD